jgi:hypothetical protein
MGWRLDVLGEAPITADTKRIELRIRGEKDFDPMAELDIESLRFGSYDEVNYGRGCKPLRTRVEGDDLIVTFKGKGSGITPDEWAPKLIGRTKQGEMVFGYANLPYVDYRPAILSARRPWYDKETGAVKVSVENFGLSASKTAEIAVTIDGKPIGTTTIGALAPYARTTATLPHAILGQGTCEVTAAVDGKVMVLGKFSL